MSSLYIVSTPIGNLKDITLRAIEILGQVDLILAEDTRKTGLLLKRYDINTPLESFHEHNEEKKLDDIVARMSSETKIALVSDAGTPTLSDPGFKLVREAIRNNIRVVPIPGASSILASLVSSGLATDQFIFLGYFPKKGGKQKDLLNYIDKALSLKPATVIFFESPFRIKKTLSLLAQRLPNKDVVVARELTKMHEEFIRGEISEVVKMDIKSKGEFTILLR